MGAEKNSYYFIKNYWYTKLLRAYFKYFGIPKILELWKYLKPLFSF